MNLKNIFGVFALPLIFQICGFCQTVEVSKLLEETQIVAGKTAYQHYYEFSQNFKTTVEDKNGRKSTRVYESVCSYRGVRCQIITVEKDGIALSEKEIRKNRQKAAEKLQKAENTVKIETIDNKEIKAGYGFMILTWFSPNLYLKYCDAVTLEKIIFESRPTYKIKIENCKLPAGNNLAVQFMPKTEGFIWIDERDKAIVKMEVFAKKEFAASSASEKPVLMMTAARVPEGFWFWKTVRVEALKNRLIFPEYDGNWQIDFFNYKHFTVDVEKLENAKP